MPNALCILVNLAHAMKRYVVYLAFRIYQLEGGGALCRKRYLCQWDMDDAVLCPIVIARSKFPWANSGSQ